MPEYSVQPVTVLCALGWVSFFSSLAANVMRVVAHTDQPKPPIVVVDQTIWTARNEPLAFVTLVVKIALGLMSDSFCS